MLAGRIVRPGEIRLFERPEAELDGPGAIIFEPRLACLCGSDLPFFRGERPEYPLEWGLSLHEMVGTVVASSGGRFRPGDRVLAVPVDQHGLFERFSVNEERAVPLDPRLAGAEEIAVLAQPLGTVLHALRRLPPVTGLDVAVVGQGPIGQLFSAVLRGAGAREVIAIDVLESRLGLSPRLGATATVCTAREDPVAAVSRITGGRLADLVVEAVGHRDLALNLCVDLCRPDGRLLSFGIPPERVDGLRWRDLLFKKITVHTSHAPDFSLDFPLAMRLIAEGRIDVAPLITHRFPLAEIQQAFETFRDRSDGAQKVLLRFRD